MQNLHEFLTMIQREAGKKMQANDMAAILIERRELEWLNNYLEKKPTEDGFELLAGYAMAGILANPMWVNGDSNKIAEQAIEYAKALNKLLKNG